jgi:hypothetical protein
MQFDGHSTNFDLISDIDFLAGTNSTSYPTEDKTRNLNLAYDRVVSLILQSDGRWQWVDANDITLPTGTMTLTSGTQTYDIGTAVSTFLTVVKVAVKDTGGVYHYLDALDQRDLHGIHLTDTTVGSGVPTAYVKTGDLITLNRIPNYTQSAGIKIDCQKNVTYFTPSDTTKEPGFAVSFHRLLSLYAARDYCAVNDMPKRLVVIDKEIAKMEAGLVAFYSLRSKDERPRLQLRRENYGSEDARPGQSSKTMY